MTNGLTHCALGETNASWMMEGVLKFLTSDSREARVSVATTVCHCSILTSATAFAPSFGVSHCAHAEPGRSYCGELSMFSCWDRFKQVRRTSPSPSLLCSLGPYLRRYARPPKALYPTIYHTKLMARRMSMEREIALYVSIGRGPLRILELNDSFRILCCMSYPWFDSMAV